MWDLTTSEVLLLRGEAAEASDPLDTYPMILSSTLGLAKRQPGSRVWPQGSGRVVIGR